MGMEAWNNLTRLVAECLSDVPQPLGELVEAVVGTDNLLDRGPVIEALKTIGHDFPLVVSRDLARPHGQRDSYAISPEHYGRFRAAIRA